MTLHCPFNNMPCMRGCAGTGPRQCQLQLAHDNAGTITPLQSSLDVAQRLPEWMMRFAFTPPRRDPPPPPRYDGSLDDWDVDHFTPPPPPEPTPQQLIEQRLAALGIEFDCSSYEEVWVSFTFPDGVTIDVDRWNNGP